MLLITGYTLIFSTNRTASQFVQQGGKSAAPGVNAKLSNATKLALASLTKINDKDSHAGGQGADGQWYGQ